MKFSRRGIESTDWHVQWVELHYVEWAHEVTIQMYDSQVIVEFLEVV